MLLLNLKQAHSAPGKTLNIEHRLGGSVVPSPKTGLGHRLKPYCFGRRPDIWMETNSRSTVTSTRRCTTLSVTVFLVFRWIAGIIRASNCINELQTARTICLTRSSGRE